MFQEILNISTLKFETIFLVYSKRWFINERFITGRNFIKYKRFKEKE